VPELLSDLLVHSNSSLPGGPCNTLAYTYRKLFKLTVLTTHQQAVGQQKIPRQEADKHWVCNLEPHLPLEIGKLIPLSFYYVVFWHLVAWIYGWSSKEVYQELP